MNEEEKSKISYSRSRGINYMILEGQQALLDYEEKMLSENTIPSLLTFHIVRTDGGLQYWYDITGSKSVRSFVEREGLSCRQVREILAAVDAACHALGQYLITEDKISLHPDTVFLKKSGAGIEARLCFFPPAKEEKPLLALAEFFISAVDHADDAATRLCYAIYEEAVREETRVSDLLQLAEAQQENEEADYGRQNISEAAAPEEEKEEPVKKTAKRWRQKEEDFWEPPKEAVTMEEVFLDADEEEELSLMERVRAFFLGLPSGLFGGIRKKKEEIFPPKDLEEDLIYDPKADYSEPTVLLCADKDSCFGKLIYEGTEDEQDYMITTDSFAIGTSAKGNQAVLHSPVVSHHHARITKQEDKFFLEDLNSTNGTYLNGEAITINQKYELKYMDKLHFANVAYRIV